MTATAAAPDDPTPEKGWKPAFLAELRASANVSAAAARAAGVNRQYCYEARAADPAFASAWEDAVEEAVDELELEMRRRAVRGVRKPVYQNGKRVGTVREYSDTLAIFLAKAHRPAKYRDRVSTEHDGKIEVVWRYADRSPDNDAEAPPGPGPDPGVEG